MTAVYLWEHEQPSSVYSLHLCPAYECLSPALRSSSLECVVLYPEGVCTGRGWGMGGILAEKIQVWVFVLLHLERARPWRERLP